LEKNSILALKFSKAIKNALKNTFYYIILTSVAFIMAFPFFWMVSTSLKRPGDIFILPIKWFPNPVIIDQYINIWRILPFKNYCINSVIVSLSIVVGSIFICSLAAFGFTRPKNAAEDYDLKDRAEQLGGAQAPPSIHYNTFARKRWQPSPKWALWLDTNGAQGEEPPEEVKRLRSSREKVVSATTVEEQNALLNEAFKLHSDNL